MSTARANLAVGPPYDLAIYPSDTFTVEEFRILPDSAVLSRIQAIWQRHASNSSGPGHAERARPLDDLDRRVQLDRAGN